MASPAVCCRRLLQSLYHRANSKLFTRKKASSDSVPTLAILSLISLAVFAGSIVVPYSSNTLCQCIGLVAIVRGSYGLQSNTNCDSVDANVSRYRAHAPPVLLHHEKNLRKSSKKANKPKRPGLCLSSLPASLVYIPNTTMMLTSRFLQSRTVRAGVAMFSTAKNGTVKWFDST
jgi:hypothetical protein